MAQRKRKYTLADLWERDVWQSYYDGMEAIREGRLEDAEQAFRHALRLNPAFPGSYEGLAAAAKEKGNDAEARRLTDLAFKKVTAAYPLWPKRLPWGVMENRPILRIVQMQAMVYHEDRSRAEAEKLYRLLLQLNPGDNQGIRYLLAALRKGLSPDEVG